MTLQPEGEGFRVREVRSAPAGRFDPETGSFRFAAPLLPEQAVVLTVRLDRPPAAFPAVLTLEPCLACPPEDARDGTPPRRELALLLVALAVGALAFWLWRRRAAVRR